MPPLSSGPPPMRADARRNRERLVAAAAQALATGQEGFSLDAVARSAGLGSGTLYRHFPTREDLVEEVYRHEVSPLRDAAVDLLDSQPPAVALQQWLTVFAEWATAKKGVCEALVAMSSSGRFGTGPVCDQVLDVMRLLLEAGKTSGDLIDDIDPVDLGVIVSGLLTAAGGPSQRQQLARLFAVVVNGLRQVDR
jgi:AcrR family transcriptional regulator